MSNIQHKKNNKFFFILLKVFGVLVSILSVLFFLTSFEIATIPTSSMLTVLKPNEACLVSKIQTGEKLNSLVLRALFQKPFKYLYFKSDLSKKTFLPTTEIKRGDVVCFVSTANPEVNFCKRIIGVPGDKVYFKNNVLHINDKPIQLKLIGETTLYDDHDKMNKVGNLYEETHENGKAYNVFYEKSEVLYSHGNTPVVLLPKDYFYVVGDFRSDSEDSRGSAGIIHRSRIIGKLVCVLYSSPFLMKLMAGISGNMIFSFSVLKNVAMFIFNVILVLFTLDLSRFGKTIV